MQTKLSRIATPVLLIAILALSACKQGDKPEDALAQDTSLAHDLQLANADTTAQPQLKDVPVTIIASQVRGSGSSSLLWLTMRPGTFLSLQGAAGFTIATYVATTRVVYYGNSMIVYGY